MFPWTPKQSRPLSLCASNYFYFVVSWEITDGNDLNGEHDQWKFSGLNIVWVGTILDWIFWIGVTRVGIFWVVIILGENFPGGNWPGRSYPGCESSGWEFSGWELSWVGIFLGGNFPGRSYPVGIIRVAIFRVWVFLVPENSTLQCIKSKTAVTQSSKSSSSEVFYKKCIPRNFSRVFFLKKLQA